MYNRIGACLLDKRKLNAVNRVRFVRFFSLLKFLYNSINFEEIKKKSPHKAAIGLYFHFFLHFCLHFSSIVDEKKTRTRSKIKNEF